MSGAPRWVLLAWSLPVLLVAALPAPRARQLGGAGLVLLALALAASMIAGDSGGTSFMAVNAALVATGVLVVAWAVVLAGRRRAAPSIPQSVSPAGSPAIPEVLLLVGLSVTALAPHLLVLGVGAVLAIASAVRAAVARRQMPHLAVLVFGALLLASALTITSGLLGPGGGAIAALLNGPFSPAAERLLAMLTGAGVLLLAGLPPLSGVPWGRSLALLGAIVLARVALPAWPSGMGEWQPLALLLLGLSAAAAARRGCWTAILAAGGIAVLWSGDSAAVLWGLGLVGWAFGSELAASLGRARGVSLVPRWSGTAALVPALAALPAFVPVLRQQVLLSTLAALLLATGFAWRALARTAPPPPPL